ncbi:MAG: glycosyl hydrolase family 28-related protein [Acidobacteriota bacterium]
MRRFRKTFLTFVVASLFGEVAAQTSLPVFKVTDYDGGNCNNPNGTPDCTNAIRQAIIAAAASGNAGTKVVYFPNGLYRVTSAIDLTSYGAGAKDIRLQGVNRSQSIIYINSTWTSGATYLFRFYQGEQSNEMSNLAIAYEQPDTSNRSQLTNYGAAIKLDNATRWKIENVQIMKAWTAVDCNGNCGGGAIDDLEISSFLNGIYINGALDTIKISRLHIWPFGMSQNQITAFRHHDSIGIRAQRADGLVVSNSLISSGTGILLEKPTAPYGSKLGPNVELSNVQLDLNQRCLEIQSGHVLITSSSLHSTFQDMPAPTTSLHAVYYRAGLLTMTGTELSYGSWQSVFGTPNALVYSKRNDLPERNDPSAGSVPFGDAIFMVGCFLDTKGYDVSGIFNDAPDTGIGVYFTVQDCYFLRNPDLTYTRHTMDFTGLGRFTVLGNRSRDRGFSSGGAKFIYMPNDEWHRMIGNAATGWSNQVPNCYPSCYGIYRYNNSPNSEPPN